MTFIINCCFNAFRQMIWVAVYFECLWKGRDESAGLCLEVFFGVQFGRELKSVQNPLMSYYNSFLYGFIFFPNKENLSSLSFYANIAGRVFLVITYDPYNDMVVWGTWFLLIESLIWKLRSVTFDFLNWTFFAFHVLKFHQVLWLTFYLFSYLIYSWCAILF